MGPKTREGPPFNELIEPKLERWRKILRKLWGKPKQDAGSHHHLCTTPTIPMRLMHWGEIGTWSFSLWRSIHQRCLFLSHSVSSLIAYCEPSHHKSWDSVRNLIFLSVWSKPPSVTLGEAWKVASALRLTRRLQLLKKAIYPAGVRKYMHGLKLITWSSQFLIQVLHQRSDWKKQNVQERPKRKK